MVTTAEDWTKWESQIVNGVFPLLRYLGKSNHSVVFLTEAQDCANAAIKLVPADPLQTQAQLSNWRAAAALSHPHLIRLLDCGDCQLGGYPFLFVVMEYAEQTLAQILPHRALTADEVTDMLRPTIDALAFLHRQNLVHRRLKPPNFLVVNDQLKLASDTICPAGESAAANDVRDLGMVIAEALTRCTPAQLDELSNSDSFPPTIAPEFSGIVQRCLSRDPANLPTVAELEAQINSAPQAPAVLVPVLPDAAPRAAATPVPAKRPLFVAAVALSVVAVVALWAASHLFRSHSNSHQPTASAAPLGSRQATPAAGVSQNPNPPATVQPAQAVTEGPRSVLHQEIPDVSRSARESIHGHIKVSVRVSVDHAGVVVTESIEDPGSSRYFARAASAAAKKWKFAPADNQNSREWLLRFEFGRDGTAARATPRS